MELTDWAIIVGICTLLSLLMGVIVGYATVLVRDYRLAKIEKEVERLTMAAISVKGNEAREAKAARMEEAMAKAALIMQNKEVTDKKSAILQLALEYPDIAMSLAKKVL